MRSYVCVWECFSAFVLYNTPTNNRNYQRNKTCFSFIYSHSRCAYTTLYLARHRLVDFVVFFFLSLYVSFVLSSRLQYSSKKKKKKLLNSIEFDFLLLLFYCNRFQLIYSQNDFSQKHFDFGADCVLCRWWGRAPFFLLLHLTSIKSSGFVILCVQMFSHQFGTQTFVFGILPLHFNSDFFLFIRFCWLANCMSKYKCSLTL